MPVITDYATLKQAIVDFTHRTDLAAFADYFIQGAQEMINSDVFDKNEGNGIRAMEGPFTGTITGSGNVGVPSDWLAPKDIQVVVGGGQISTLGFKSASWIYDAYPMRAPAGPPAYMARDNTVFIFGPFPDQPYVLQGTYYLKAALLTSGATTNWMVTAYPLMLHAACMVKAVSFMKDSEALQTWTALYDDLIQGVVDQDKSERWASATMQMDLG